LVMAVCAVGLVLLWPRLHPTPVVVASPTPKPVQSPAVRPVETPVPVVTPTPPPVVETSPTAPPSGGTIEEQMTQANQDAKDGQYDKAISEYSEIIRQDPTNADAFSNRGSA